MIFVCVLNVKLIQSVKFAEDLWSGFVVCFFSVVILFVNFKVSLVDMLFHRSAAFGGTTWMKNGAVPLSQRLSLCLTSTHTQPCLHEGPDSSFLNGPGPHSLTKPSLLQWSTHTAFNTACRPATTA